jgi:hypothetical protein
VVILVFDTFRVYRSEYRFPNHIYGFFQKVGQGDLTIRQNSKSEARNSKQIQSSKLEILRMILACLGFRIWNLFRISHLGFRIFFFRQVDVWHSSGIGRPVVARCTHCTYPPCTALHLVALHCTSLHCIARNGVQRCNDGPNTKGQFARLPGSRLGWQSTLLEGLT